MGALDQGAARRPRIATPWWMLPAVLAATAAAYASSLDGALVYDDLLLVGRNPRIAELSNLPQAFSQGYWDFLGDETTGTTPYWRPLTAAALTLAYAISGTSPWAYHALSLFAHLGATAAAFAVGRRASRDPWVGLAVGLLFGLHPVHVESVAWISALNDPLFGLFTLLSLLAFLRWRDRGSRGLALGAAAWAVPALLAKELGVAVVPLALAADLGRRRTTADEPGPLGGLVALGRAYGPLLVVLGLYAVARAAVFESPLGGLERTVTGLGVGPGRLAQLRLEMLGGALWLLVAPLRLDLFRPFRPDLAWTDLALLADLAMVALLAAATWRAFARRRRPHLLGLLAIPAALLPALVRPASLGRFPLSDRFLYLAVLGWALALATFAFRHLPRTPAVVLLVALAGAYAARTATRVEAWSDEEALFRAHVEARPDAVYARWGLGRVLLGRYRDTRDPALLAEALATYEAAADRIEEVLAAERQDVLVSSTDVLQVRLGYAWTLLHAAELDPFRDVDTPIALLEALRDEVAGIRRGAEEARAAGREVWGEPLELERVHDALGVAYALAGRPADAEAAFLAALAENPDFVEAHRNLAALLLERGEARRARTHLERALAAAPGHRPTRLRLARALVEEGFVDRAETLARELHEEDGGSPEPAVVLATARARRGDLAGALRWLDAALGRDPEHGPAHFLRGQVLERTGEREEALVAFRRAAELDPSDLGAHYNLGALLLAEGAERAAFPHLVRAYGLARDPALLARLRGELARLELPGVGPALELEAIERARGDVAAALGWVERALALRPGDAELRFRRGRALRDLGRLELAADEMAAAVAELGDRLVPRAELGLLYAELGRTADARRELEAALALPAPEGLAPDAAAALRARVRERLDGLGGTVGPAPGG